jgi:glucosamine 6-phosphate synthetase-like amidotransferase/phosphosugar isomerase protein
MKDSFFEANRYPQVETLRNFCVIWKGTLEDFEEVKALLLKRGATLIYQTHSLDKIIVTKEAKIE